MEIKDLRIGQNYIEKKRYPFDVSFRGKIKLSEDDLKDIIEYHWQDAYEPC